MTDIATRETRVVTAAGSRRRHNGGGPRAGTIAAFLTPFFLPFVLFYLVPIAYALWQSFLVVRRTGGQYGTSYTTFGGFEQYVQVFQNTEFWASIGRIALFGIVQVPVMLFVALIMALLLDTPAAEAQGVLPHRGVHAVCRARRHRRDHVVVPLLAAAQPRGRPAEGRRPPGRLPRPGRRAVVGGERLHLAVGPATTC